MSTPIGYEQARAAANRFLSEPVDLYEEVTARDSSGGSTVTYVKYPQTRPLLAWIAAPSARRAAGGMADREADIIASQVENTSVVVCTLPNGTPVKEGDLAFVPAASRWWMVTAEISLDSPRTVTTRVLLREIDPPHPSVISEG